MTPTGLRRRAAKRRASAQAGAHTRSRALDKVGGCPFERPMLLREFALEQCGPQGPPNEEQAVQGALLGHRHLVDRTAGIATCAVPLQHGFKLAPLGMGPSEI